LKIVGVLVVLIAILFIGASLYINSHKQKVLTLINTELNKSLDGKVGIGDIETSFFRGFPRVSVSLKNVIIRDKQFAIHKHTLLQAHDVDVAVNLAALLRGAIRIHHVDINNAAIDLYTDSTGYSNTSVFKKKAKKPTKENEGGGTVPELGQLSLNKVNFTVDNQEAKKLFKFEVDNLKGKMNFPDSGWHAEAHLKVLARSMAFNTARGSFIANKLIEGELVAGYNDEKGKINVSSNNFNIGGDEFKLNAAFVTGKKPSTFAFHLAADEILWSHAASLVAQNIKITLDKFNLDKPIGITANISGSFGGGDPLLLVTADVKNNRLTVPGAIIDDCNFNGVFTNNDVNGKGLGDENSVIRLFHLTGNYGKIPFAIDTGSITNLVKPIATGNFRSSFPIVNLNTLMGSKVAKLNSGTANVKLRYKADIIDLRLTKPIIAGDISLSHADMTYLPSNLVLKNTSFALHFIKNDLLLDNIRIQTGRSVVTMQGRVNNFMNLYYDAPEKILLTWQINSPQLYLGELFGYLNQHQQNAAKPARRNSGNFIDQLSNVLDRARADLHIRAANIHYNKFLATNAKADILLSGAGIAINNFSVNHAGGSLLVKGNIKQGSSLNHFDINADVNKVNIHEFFYAFDNFGLQDLTSKNLKGFLSAKALVGGSITNKGDIVPRSINGSVKINLRNGALLNFDPLKKVGKFAFPFRDLENIMIPVLDAKFDLHGDKIYINPMQISSSVLNADVSGTYALTKGTNLALDIPLRNPKKDEDITDEEELKKRRFKGIVLHILAKDDEKTGKIKIGWNKNHQ
jgi:hypothetical protein